MPRKYLNKRSKPRARRKKKIPEPFPSSYRCKHKYVETFTLDPGISTPAAAYYRCNGMFDPTVAVGGHQPLMYDQLTPIYSHYTVLSSKATIKFISADSGSGTGSAMVYCYVNDSSVGITSFDTIMEQGKGQPRVLTNAGAGGQATVVSYFNAKKFFGVSDTKDNEQLQGNALADPLEGAYFVVGAQGVTTGVNPTAINCVITIEYNVIWTERKSVAQS